MSEEPAQIFQQSAVIPYVIREGKSCIVIVSTRKSGRWTIPKGLVEPNLTPQESALMEAEEEAGITGVITGECVGVYEYPKWGGTCRVAVFPMAVARLSEEWLESDERERKIIPLAEVPVYIQQPRLCELITRNADKTRT